MTSPTADGQGWRPIESAPKDGRYFLGYVPLVGHRMILCFYTSQGLLLNESCQPHPWPVTHWHPLPAPPTSGDTP